MLRRTNIVVDSRDVVWEATPSAGTPTPAPLPLSEAPEPGGTLETGDASEPEGMCDNLFSAQTTPLPVLGGKIPHQLRTVSSMTQLDDDDQPKGTVPRGWSPRTDSDMAELSDGSLKTVSSQAPDSGRHFILCRESSDPNCRLDCCVSPWDADIRAA